MWFKMAKIVKVIFLLLPLLKAEDSLQSALNAVNRRQRDLADYSGGYDDYIRYPYQPNDDSFGFLGSDMYPSEDHPDIKNGDFEQGLVNYLEKRGILDGEKYEGFSSSFRERVEKDRARQKEKLSEILLNKLYNEQEEEEEYGDQLRKAYEKYSKNFPEHYVDDYPKNPYYNLGWDSVGMQKRNRYYQPEASRDGLYYFSQRDLDGEGDDWYQPRSRKSSAITYPYLKKRFPVAKRSSNYYPTPYQSEVTHQQKRSPKKDLAKTDPKVEKELTKIFKSKDLKADKKEKIKKSAETVKPKGKNLKTENGNTKEEVPEFTAFEKPVDMKKKSIDWSDYFGLDRRKKEDESNKEWFIEKFHNSVTVPSKRSEEYGLNIFRDHDNPKSTNKTKSEDTKIKEMDNKLKNMEETIVDDTLKFTGAHEDVADSKEMQEVKDKIISRLAAAYSLEKMRKALKSYKLSLERDKEKMMTSTKTDQKRVSVPRKQAIDEERQKAIEEDNNIKCTEGVELCDEENYKPPNELLEEALWNKGKCPRIERACKEGSALLLENYGKIFEAACLMHQMCLFCGDNSWHSPLRQCNLLFLAKANEMCDDDPECERAIRYSIKYLYHVGNSLRNDPYGDCNLECPDRR